MIGEALLLTLAQIGLAFAGISSILTIFQKRGRTWMLRDVMGMKFMLEHSIGLLVYSIQPFLWYYLCDTANTLIKGYGSRLFDTQRAAMIISSFWLAMFNIWEIIKLFQRRRAMAEINERAAYDKPLLYFFLPMTILIAILLLLNMFFGLFGLYLLGLSWQLTNGVTQFSVFIIVLTRSEAQEAAQSSVPAVIYQPQSSKLLSGESSKGGV
jgi:hypothetical protein